MMTQKKIVNFVIKLNTNKNPGYPRIWKTLREFLTVLVCDFLDFNCFGIFLEFKERNVFDLSEIQETKSSRFFLEFKKWNIPGFPKIQ